MKNWVKALISSVIVFLISITWQYVTLKHINWLEAIVTALLFGTIELIFYLICECMQKGKKKNKLPYW